MARSRLFKIRFSPAHRNGERFTIKHIGHTSFCAIVTRLRDVDLGSNANCEWARRIEILERHRTIECFRDSDV